MTPMPARILVVVSAVTNRMSAIEALEDARQIEMLVTRVTFPEGEPNGVALALMARVKKPGLKVLFVALPEMQAHTEGVSEFLPVPADLADMVALIGKMLG
jgi:hypothetical protein